MWPQLAVRLWKNKLLDAVSDRCVRMCRRDQRDSAEAEQALYEQLDEVLDRAFRTTHQYLCAYNALVSGREATT